MNNDWVTRQLRPLKIVQIDSFIITHQNEALIVVSNGAESRTHKVVNQTFREQNVYLEEYSKKLDGLRPNQELNNLICHEDIMMS